MCVDVDEPWEVYESYRAVAQCADCGRVAPGRTEGRSPSIEGYSDDEDPRWEKAALLALNDGVPDWSEEFEDEYYERGTDLVHVLPIEIETTAHACFQCLEARRWLEVWCSSYWFDRYRDDIIEHWDENEITHSHATGRLVLACRGGWTLRGREVTPAEAKQLVDASLAALKGLVSA